MPDWSRPRRVHNMRKVLRKHTGKSPPGCEFWVLAMLAVLTAALAWLFQTRWGSWTAWKWTG